MVSIAKTDCALVVKIVKDNRKTAMICVRMFL